MPTGMLVKISKYLLKIAFKTKLNFVIQWNKQTWVVFLEEYEFLWIFGKFLPRSVKI